MLSNNKYTKVRSIRKCKNLAFLLPSFIGVTVFFVVPFFEVVRRSFFKQTGGGWVGLENYEVIVSNQAFHLATGNTFLFIIVSVPLLVVLSLLAALLVRRYHNIKTLLKAGFLLPMVIPAAAVALIWQLLFDYSGLLNNLLLNFGFSPQGWLNSSLAFWVLVGGYLWRNLGFSMVLWLVALEGIQPNLYEAAELDGAGRLMVLQFITLPLIAPASFIVAVLAFINSFKLFREAFLVAGSYPHESMYTLQHLFNNWFTTFSFDKVSAGATIVSVVMLMLVFLLYKAWGREK